MKKTGRWDLWAKLKRRVFPFRVLVGLCIPPRPGLASGCRETFWSFTASLELSIGAAGSPKSNYFLQIHPRFVSNTRVQIGVDFGDERLCKTYQLLIVRMRNPSL